MRKEPTRSEIDLVPSGWTSSRAPTRVHSTFQHYTISKTMPQKKSIEEFLKLVSSIGELCQKVLLDGKTKELEKVSEVVDN